MFTRLFRQALRLFFRLLYHQMAWAYDGVAWLVSLGQWKAWGQAALPHLRGQRILELAHGPGHLLVTMQRQGLQAVGLDLSPQMGKLAQRHLKRAGLPAPLVRARAQALPFRGGAFDSIVSTFPTEFIFDPATVNEAARVLNDTGRLVVIPGIAFSPHSLPARLLAWLYTATGQGEPAPAAIQAAFEQAGFSLSRRRRPMGTVEVLIGIADKSARTQLWG